jgi:MFS family permease
MSSDWRNSQALDMPEPARLERILPFLTLTVFLDLIGFGIILPLLPSYIADMGGSAQTVGVLFASFAASQFVATPVLGRISDRYGRRRVIVQSLLANAIAMGLFALAADRKALWLLFASRILAGATSGNIGACQAAISDVARGPERVQAMGKLGASISLGVMLGPWIGGQVSRLGNSAPPLFAGAMALIALLGVVFFMKETNPVVLSASMAPTGGSIAPTRPKLRFGALAGNPKIAVVMVLYFLTFLYMTNVQTVLALLASERFDWGKDKAGNLFGLFGLVSLVMQFGVIGPLSKRAGPRAVVAMAAVLATVGLLTIGFSPTAAVMVAGLVGLASAVGLTQPQLAALASNYAGTESSGIVLGFAQSSGSLARAIGPLIWGALYLHVGPSASFVGGAIAALFSSFVAARVSAERSPP